MGLADTAKNLQQTTASRELFWLRKLRAFTEEWTDARLIAEIEKIEAYSQTEEGKKNQLQVYLQTIDVLEKGSLSNFYRDVLEYAEIKQRKDRNGGGEKAIKAHWDKLQQMERNIKSRYEKQRREEANGYK